MNANQTLVRMVDFVRILMGFISVVVATDGWVRTVKLVGLAINS